MWTEANSCRFVRSGIILVHLFSFEKLPCSSWPGDMFNKECYKRNRSGLLNKFRRTRYALTFSEIYHSFPRGKIVFLGADNFREMFHTVNCVYQETTESTYHMQFILINLFPYRFSTCVSFSFFRNFFPVMSSNLDLTFAISASHLSPACKIGLLNIHYKAIYANVLVLRGGCDESLPNLDARQPRDAKANALSAPPKSQQND